MTNSTRNISKVTTLNPFAPEYHPIPPGVAPNPYAPPPPFFRRQPIAASRQHSRPPPPPRHRFIQTNFFPTPPPPPPPPAHTDYYAAPYYPVSQNRTDARPTPPPRPKRTRLRYGRRIGRDGGARCMHKKEGSRRIDHQVVPLNRDDAKTTVMIKNIPYDCPRGDLMGMVDDFCLLENCKDDRGLVSAYDFLYLPIDFRTKKSRGFAFVNFTNAAAAWKFFQAFHRKNWGSIRHAPNWPKQIEIVAAKYQGKDALVNHISKSNFECETDEYLPVAFEPARDGSGQYGEGTAIGIRRDRGRAARNRWEARRNH